MSKFKQGDRVILNAHAGIWQGIKATVEYVDERGRAVLTLDEGSAYADGVTMKPEYIGVGKAGWRLDLDLDPLVEGITIVSSSGERFTVPDTPGKHDVDLQNGQTVTVIVAPKVDPDLLLARLIAARVLAECDSLVFANSVDNGRQDNHYVVRIALAALKER